ncbi:hypothetical protein [Raoultibacter massiliensis]|uniref:hypothetical protein n=1 Tax=Raoultibacter massiliensis TaxID=1852371 RepID=UPI003A938CE2
MSLYWPEGNIAIDIVDDPNRNPFDAAAHPDATVLSVTQEDLESLESLDEIARTVASHLGVELPEADEETLEKRRELHRMLFDA